MRLTPRGGPDRIDGLTDGPDGLVLQDRVAAPPENGAANAALIRLLSRALQIPRTSIRMVSGQTARVKAVEIDGDPPEITSRLDGLT